MRCPLRSQRTTMKKTTKKPTLVSKLRTELTVCVENNRQLRQTIETLTNRLRTLEGERNALRQMARFARLSTMDVSMLNSRMETIAALLQQSTKLIAELQEPKT